MELWSVLQRHPKNGSTKMTFIKKNRIQESILEFLSQYLDAEHIKTLDFESSLFTQQIIDSMGFLDLLSYLEDNLEVELNLAQYDPKQYTSISGLTEIIGKVIS